MLASTHSSWSCLLIPEMPRSCSYLIPHCLLHVVPITHTHSTPHTAQHTHTHLPASPSWLLPLPTPPHTRTHTLPPPLSRTHAPHTHSCLPASVCGTSVQVYERALPYFELAAAIQPQEVKWSLMVASCYRRIGAYGQAMQR